MLFALTHRLPWHRFVIVTLLLCLTACTPRIFSLLERNLHDMETHGVIAGVLIRPDDKAPVYLTLMDSDGVCVDTLRFGSDHYALFAPVEHAYCLMAFQDINNNGLFDQTEPAVSTCDATPLALSRNQRNLRIDLTLSTDQQIPPQMAKVCPVKEATPSKLRLIVGDIADFNRPEFGPEFAHKGMWAPVDFLREAGIGIYFLEPYDPRKIPVLFINGAVGSPLDWRHFYQRMDTSRYQAWFYFYPSGLPLKRLTETLAGMTRNLHDRYSFNHMAVVAHSMGGLIGRGVLLDPAIAQQDFVDVFVSFSAPWEGLDSAKIGIKYAPAAVPSWYDIATDSPYQQAIFKHKLPGNISYYLLFGYKDTAVPIKSLLFDPAQREAKRIFGYDEGHVSILASPQVIDDFFSILDEAW